MSEDTIQIKEKLVSIIYLLAKEDLDQMKTQKDKILFLFDLKMDQKQISILLNIPYNTVTARISENR